MLQPFDLFALFRPGYGTRYFLALESGYPGKRIQAVPVELDPKEPTQGVLFGDTDWAKANMPPCDMLVKERVEDVKTEYETKPLGRLTSDAHARLARLMPA